MKAEHKEQKEKIQMEFDFLAPTPISFRDEITKLTKSEKALYKIIPTGKKNAVNTKQLAKTIGVEYRRITALIQQIRRKNIAICSSQEPNYSGIYKPANIVEFAEFFNRYQRANRERNKTETALKYSKYGIKLLTGGTTKKPPDKSN